MVTYYTLDEAARILGMAPDELRRMAGQGKLRAFMDRGTMRFRNQEIDELARQRGQGSNASVPILDVPPLKPADSPAPAKQEPSSPAGKEVFPFDLGTEDEQVDIGKEILRETAGGSKKGAPSSRSKLASPRPGSDSEVRLVADGSDLGFQIASDSGAGKGADSVVPVSPRPRQTQKRPSRMAGPESQIDPGKSPRPRQGAPLSHLDSGIRLVPVGDSTEPPAAPAADAGAAGSVRTDADVRLDEQLAPGPIDSKVARVEKPGGELLLTEEIDLDAELSKAAEQEQTRASQVKPKSQARVPQPESPGAAEPGSPLESSSDFELTPVAELKETSPLDLSSSEIPVMAADDEVLLGSDPELKGVDSGINLQEPADSGISLEQEPAGEGMEFELSLDADTTPKPATAPEADDSDSEFELSLDTEGGTPRPAKAADDSSSSEFELTLDDTGGLAPIEEEQSVEESAADEDRDIFETDFEVPALDEESAEVAAEGADTDLESSDFDLALDEQDIEPDDESQSQVVVLPEEGEEELEDEETPARGQRRGIDADEELEEEEEAYAGGAVAAAPARWGVVPVLLLMPCVVALFIVGLMSFELVRGMWGYHHSQKLTGVLVDPISKLFPGSEE